MNENNERITPIQWMLLVTGFMQGSILLLSLVDSTLNQDTWVTIIAGYVLSIPFIVTYFSLSRQFPNRTLIEIHDIVYGKVAGKIVSAIYIIFFCLLFSMNYRQIVDFYLGYIMPETNPIYIYLTVALFCAYAVKKGISSIAKINIYALIFWAVTNIGTFLLLLGHMDFSNYLPMFESSFADFAKGTTIMAGLPYCEVLCLMMVTPYVSATTKKKQKTPLTKYALIGGIIAMLGYLIIDMRNTTTLGASRGIYAESSFQSVRLVNIGEFLTRMELFVALYITAVMFIKVSVWQFAAAKGISQYFGLKTYIPLLLPLTAIGIVHAITAFDSGNEVNEYIDYYIVLAALFEAVIPVITLIAAKRKKRHSVKEVVP